MSKVLFFNPPSRQNVYLNTNVKVGAPNYPNLTLATLAGSLIGHHQVKIIDLDLPNIRAKNLLNSIKTFKPDIVASTIKTPDYFIVKELMAQVKSHYSSILTIVGGPHPTALPKETSREKCFDIVVVGEGDTAINDILNLKSLSQVKGIYYKSKSGKLIFTGERALVKNLDDISYPAWNLFELNKYQNSRLSSRANPVGHIETSRGCSYNCNFCNKLVFGTKFRTKSVKRVVDEMEYMLKCGFKEIHIADDSFTQDINHAKGICREIIKRRLKFPWALINGVRVNLVDQKFFNLAKQAGCWMVGFGIESGDQKVLDAINKKITLMQIEKAVGFANKAGLVSFGFFIFGLSGENESSMKKTIAFANKIPLGIAKFDICVPYPGTRYYNELKKEGRIKSENWAKYICHQTEEILFDHQIMSWEMVEKYYKKAFRDFYLRPSYLFRRFKRSLINGDMFYDITAFLQSKW